ncbi:MAG: hypothetical protein O6931_00160 [Gammaproteobacteria bacterium]|nr:hypothetical protein [Gammaproteobacteria bacterium]
MSVQNPTIGDPEDRTYTDVLSYLRQAEPDQVAAFRKYFRSCKKKDKDRIVGLDGIMRALDEVASED